MAERLRVFRHVGFFCFLRCKTFGTKGGRASGMNGSCWEKGNMGSGSSTAPSPSRHLESSVILSPLQVSDHESVHTYEEIAEEAKGRLYKSSHTSLQGLSCEFDHGVLFLRGKLPSFCCKQLAQAVVSGIEGVTRVVNETEVVF